MKMSEYQSATRRVRQVHEYQGSWSRLFSTDAQGPHYEQLEQYLDDIIDPVGLSIVRALRDEDE